MLDSQARDKVMNREDGVLVWDLGVRLSHWTTAVGFFVAYLTEDLLAPHVWSGYLVLALVVFRIVWGFVGSKYARFSDFVYPPSTVLTNLKEIVLAHPKRYLGHSPAGGAMVILLLSGLLGTIVTGVMLYGADQHAGPLAGAMSGVNKDLLKEPHEFLANLTLGLVGLHILGVIAASLTHKENLVRAMLTGRKRA